MRSSFMRASNGMEGLEAVEGKIKFAYLYLDDGMMDSSSMIAILI